MRQVLEGVRVLDFTSGMAGSIATMAMSDFGAEVVKVEPPGGDAFRAAPQSVLWYRGKKSVCLDLANTDGRRKAHALARQSDVVVVGLRPKTAQRLGVDYDTLRPLRDDLIYCGITGFGPKGPYADYKGYEGLVQAKSGRLMNFAGQTPREGPHHAAVKAANHAAGMAAVRGVVSALMVRDRTGQGQLVETSLLQAVTYYDMLQWLIWQMMIKDPENFPEDQTVNLRRSGPIQYLPSRTKDGKWIQLANLMFRLFHAEIRALELDYIYEDPRFKDAPTLLEEDRDELRKIILARVQDKTLDEWMSLFVNETSDVAAEPFMTSREALDHVQMIHNGHVQQVEDPAVGPTRQLGPLCHMSATPPDIQGPAPAPGQHTADVLARLNGAAQARSKTRSKGGSAELPRHPLEGVTVLDLSTVIAGPLGGSLLAELGARVIRIETLEGDWMRIMNQGIASNRTMAGTQGLSIDLKTPEGQAILFALVKRVDVLMHNMRPGATERLGVGPEQARELNPNIVYVYIGGYGSTGPYHRRPAMHPIGGAVSGGAMAQAGRGALPDPDTPMSMDEIVETSRVLGRAQDVNPDPNTSMVASTAVALGLYARDRFGEGQYIETTMIGANAYAQRGRLLRLRRQAGARGDGRRRLRPQRALSAVPGRRGLGLSGLPARKRMAAPVRRHRSPRPGRRRPFRHAGRPPRPRRRARARVGRRVRRQTRRRVGARTHRRGRRLRTGGRAGDVLLLQRRPARGRKRLHHRSGKRASRCVLAIQPRADLLPHAKQGRAGHHQGPAHLPDTGRTGLQPRAGVGVALARRAGLGVGASEKPLPSRRRTPKSLSP